MVEEIESLTCRLCGNVYTAEQMHDLIVHLVWRHGKLAEVLPPLTQFKEWQRAHRLKKKGGRKKPRVVV